MEGCAIFVALAIAVAALIVALSMRTKLRIAQEDIHLLGKQLGALQRSVASLTNNAPPTPAPEVAPAPPAAPAPAPAPPVGTYADAVAAYVAAPPPPPAQPTPQAIPTPAPPPPPPNAQSPTPNAHPTAARATEPPLPQAPSPQPQAPTKPKFDWENLVGIRLFSWIAGIALVLAAVFFLKYSVEHGWLSPAVRATMGILTGVALLVICEMRVARNYAFTANAMHGAGIAILYATLFAVHALWHLVAPGFVFFGMLVVTAVAVWLSIRRDSVFIALLGLMGGFATPALLSTGENRPIGLFSYLLLLNAGLAWVAYRKRWPALTLGSVIFTVFYQWGWVTKYLTPDQLPLAVTVFLVFAALAAAALWFGHREEDGGQLTFDRISLAAAVLPLAFAVFAAAVPAYGARIHTLFGFLLLVATGLAIIAIVRRHLWLHAIGGAAVLLTFVLWSAVSYAPAAWPAILGWLAAFVALYLIVATRVRTYASLTAPLLLFMLPALVGLEARTASPALLFGVFLALFVAVTFVASRYEQSLLHYVAALLAVVGQFVWTARFLDVATLRDGLVLYAVFGLYLLTAPVHARRFHLASHFGLAAYVLLMIVAARNALAFPPWPWLIVLAIVTIALGFTALRIQRTSLMLGGAIGAQLVLLTWTWHSATPMMSNVALVATLLVAAFFLAMRNTPASIAALVLGHIVAMGAGAGNTPPLFATLLIAHALLAIAMLALAWRKELHVLAIVSAVLTTLGTLAADIEAPELKLVFAATLYLIAIAYPLLLGRRVKESLLPHLGAVIASAAFFFIARDAMMDLQLEHIIGVLPVAQALILLALLAQLLRIEPREMTRLAMIAGTALAFITVAIPLQLDKEWITIGWALEAAALVWLFRRIPHQGLIAWSAGLFIAVFVRLVFNPNVFAYHPAEPRAIVNWYLYTYLIPAAACFAAAYWLPREWKRSIGAACAMGTVLLFVLLNIEIADFYATGPTLTFNFFSSSLAQELTYTMGWAVFAIAMLVAGIVMHARAARIAALVLLLVTILKCFLHDLARLGGLYRVGSLLGLALALVIVGVLLQKYVIAKTGEPEPVNAASD